METELIPCTVELEHLKIFLRTLSQLKKNVVHRRFFPDKYYKDLAPMPWTGGQCSSGV